MDRQSREKTLLQFKRNFRDHLGRIISAGSLIHDFYHKLRSFRCICSDLQKGLSGCLIGCVRNMLPFNLCAGGIKNLRNQRMGVPSEGDKDCKVEAAGGDSGLCDGEALVL